MAAAALLALTGIAVPAQAQVLDPGDDRPAHRSAATSLLCPDVTSASVPVVGEKAHAGVRDGVTVDLCPTGVILDSDVDCWWDGDTIWITPCWGGSWWPSWWPVCGEWYSASWGGDVWGDSEEPSCPDTPGDNVWF